MAEQIITKQCSKCKEIKPLSEFHKCRSNKDGYSYYCKVCNINYAHRYQHSEKYKAYRKHYVRTQKGKEVQKRYSQSKKGKATHKRHRQSEQFKATRKNYEKTDKFKTSRVNSMKQYHLRHPEQQKARHAVQKAIKKGDLPKINSLHCACGKQAMQYHHHKGYAPEHWLDVIPVCIKCHNHLPVASLRNR